MLQHRYGAIMLQAGRLPLDFFLTLLEALLVSEDPGRITKVVASRSLVENIGTSLQMIDFLASKKQQHIPPTRLRRQYADPHGLRFPTVGDRHCEGPAQHNKHLRTFMVSNAVGLLPFDVAFFAWTLKFSKSPFAFFPIVGK